MKVERLLKRSYGVRSRAVFLEGAHDNLRKKRFEGKDWCDNVIWWLAYKVWSAAETIPEPWS